MVPTPNGSAAFINTIKDRHSHYALSADPSINNERIKEVVNALAQSVPSAFNSQSTRIVVLFGADHHKLWDIAHDALKPIVPQEQWDGYTGPKLQGFRAAHGTALFYTNPEPLDKLKEQFPIYAQHFDPWGEHSNGMNQFALWTALEAEGLGANLQHYNPLIDEKVAEHWKIPKNWSLRAQLVFGKSSENPGAKEKLPISELVHYHGA